MDKQKYNKFTADQLRFLLGNMDKLDDEFVEVKKELSLKKDKFFDSDFPSITWAPLYENTIEECIALFILSIDVQDDIHRIASSENQLDDLNSLVVDLRPRLDNLHDSQVSEEKQKEFTIAITSITTLLAMSNRSLMVYGLYINDLVKIARDSKDIMLADRSLLKAIKIDTSVVSCPTASKRISEAVLLDDKKFLNKLKNAITGKLGVRELRNFQKMRVILQVLHESGGVNLNDEELKELFVNQLALYSDSQSSAQKNLKEFTYKFKQQKSTI